MNSARRDLSEKMSSPAMLASIGQGVGDAIGRSKPGLEALIQALPAAIYTTDASGHITFYNEAAAELWGCRPELGRSKFCGSWKLYWSDGRPLPHDECPMALVLERGQAIHGLEAVVERPDGTRIHVAPYPTPFFDDSGTLIGAVNMVVDISDRRRAELDAQRLTSIVECSYDAIISKSLDGIITSWNRGAERLFGYTAEEAIGRSVTMLIPEDRLIEEPEILDSIRRGERVDHYDTVRRRKGRESDRYFVDGIAAQGCQRKSRRRVQNCPGQHRAQANSGATKAVSERDATSHQKFLGNDKGHCNPKL
jgi:PAS domain S-box-containing protein